MKPDPAIATQPPPRPARQKAFTLPELLAVIAIMVLVMGFMGPAVNSIKDSRDIYSAAYDIAGVLDNARSYAISNNTYTWVGFYEEDGSKPWKRGETTSGKGRIIVFSVASADGSRYTNSTASSLPHPNSLSPEPIRGISKLYRFENLRLAAPTNANASWPTADAQHQINNNLFETPGPTFSYPLDASSGDLTPGGSGAAKAYSFKKIVEFNPYGEASRVTETLTSPPAEWIALGLYPTRGGIDDATHNNITPVSVFIEGLSGKVKVFQP